MENPTVNIANIIIQTINTLISNTFASIDNALYNILDDLVFINHNILNNENLRNIMGSNNSGGLITVANSLISRFFNILCFIIFNITFYIFTSSKTRAVHI